MIEPEPAPAAAPARVWPRISDVVVYLCGLLPTLFVSLPYYTRHATGSANGRALPAVVTTFNGWQTGIFGWLAAVVALIAALLVAVVQFSPLRDRNLSPRSAAAGLFALATLCAVLSAVIQPARLAVSSAVRLEIALSGGDLVIRYGRGIGFWLTLASVIIGLVVAGFQTRSAAERGRPAADGPALGPVA